MRSKTLALTVALFATTWLLAPAAFGAAEDFQCDEVNEIIALFQKGPDHVGRALERDPEGFVKRMEGWACFPEPIEMVDSRGRTYLENITCVYTNKRESSSDKDIQLAGTSFQRNIATLLACFDGEILTQAPQNYRNESKGEALLTILDRTVRAAYRSSGRRIGTNRILVEYGYFRATPGQPIYWEIKIGASVKDE